MQQELLDSFDRLLTDVDLVPQIRALTSCNDGLWGMLQDTGFLDVLVPQAQGGAGLGLRDAWGVLFAAGRHGLPIPIAQTVLARAILADRTPTNFALVSAESIALAPWVVRQSDGTLQAFQVQAAMPMAMSSAKLKTSSAALMPTP